MKPSRPLGHKSYGSIGHLIGSKLGPGDHTIGIRQNDMLTIQKRDRNDTVYVFEKFDGSNVAVAKLGGEIIALTRPGYLAETSPHRMHHRFAEWVLDREDIFQKYLKEGERICGELMLMAHGILYKIDENNPVVWFDLMQGMDRFCIHTFYNRFIHSGLLLPPILWQGDAIAIEDAYALAQNKKLSFPVKCDKPEGLVYRLETNHKFNFAAKWVRPDFKTGQYLCQEVWNKTIMK